jgi:hypothetical protein
MTHDELLAKIETAEINFRNVLKQYDALRAVMELHKPLAEAKNSPFKDACLGCSKPYPCQTIQAIEKALQ